MLFLAKLDQITFVVIFWHSANKKQQQSQIKNRLLGKQREICVSWHRKQMMYGHVGVAIRVEDMFNAAKIGDGIIFNLGSGWGTVEEHTPRDREVMGSNPARCWAFFFSSLSYQWCVPNQVLTDVQHYWFPGKNMLCHAAGDKLNIIHTSFEQKIL